MITRRHVGFINVIMIFVIAIFYNFISIDFAIADSGPSNDEIKKIFQPFLDAKNIPGHWFIQKSNKDHRIDRVDKFEVKKLKSIKSNNNGKLPGGFKKTFVDCWPVGIHLEGLGTSKGKLKNSSGEQGNFIKDLELYYCKTQFGKWEVQSDFAWIVKDGKAVNEDSRNMYLLK